MIDLRLIFCAVSIVYATQGVQASDPNADDAGGQQKTQGGITLDKFKTDTRLFMTEVNKCGGEIRPLFDAILQNGGLGLDELKMLGALAVNDKLVEGDAHMPEKAVAPAAPAPRRGLLSLLCCHPEAEGNDFDYEPQLYGQMVLAYGSVIEDIQALVGPIQYAGLAKALQPESNDALVLFKSFADRYKDYTGGK